MIVNVFLYLLYLGLYICQLSNNLLGTLQPTMKGVCSAIMIGVVVCLSSRVKNKNFFKLIIGTQIVIVLMTLFVFISKKDLNSIQGFALYLASLIISFYTKYVNNKLLSKEQYIDDSSLKDPLTKLCNRKALSKDLEKLYLNNTPFYLMFCDLDNFKQLNDTLGHEAGDELLCEIAKIWSECKYISDSIIYRLGGDEFALICKNKAGVETLAKELLSVLKKQKSRYFTYITASIGIASFPNDSNDIDKIRQYADSAMYKAKESGKNNYLFFDKEMYNEILNNYEMEKLLNEALTDYTFETVYQPQYKLIKNDEVELYGFESLIRLKNKNGVYLNTQKFIENAEKTGQIFDLDKAMLNRVLSETKQLLNKDPNLIISVNISGKHIVIDGFTEMVYDSIIEHNFPAKNLKLEITESSYIKQIKIAKQRILKLKRLGLQIALDDFGVGYSSLHYLAEIPVNTLKIDKTFVDKIEDNNKIVEIIILLGRQLKCDIIAEGVETESQLNMLRLMGCDVIQGFYLGKPVNILNALKLTKTK